MDRLDRAGSGSGPKFAINRISQKNCYKIDMEREIILILQKFTKYPYGLLWTKRALESANIALIVWYLILLSLRASSRKVRKGLYRKYSKVCVYNNISEC